MIDQQKLMEWSATLAENFDLWGLQAQAVDDGVRFVDDYEELVCSILWDAEAFAYVIRNSSPYRGSEYNSIEEAVESIVNTGLI